MPVALGILLSGSGSTYANLAAHCAAGQLDAEIAVVIGSRSGLGGLAIADELGHRHLVASKPDAVSSALADAGAQAVIMCGWLKFWDPPAPWQGRTLNIHPSLLPAYGGRGMYGINVHRAVIEAGEHESGCTVHHVDGAYDTGPIVAQSRVPVLAEDAPEDLAARVQVAERELYPRVIGELLPSWQTTVD